MTAAPIPAPLRSLASANLICVASMLVWAAGLPAADLVIPLIPPIALTALRTGLAAAVLLLVWVLVEGAGPLRRANWGRGILVGGICIGLAAVRPGTGEIVAIYGAVEDAVAP